MKRIISLILIVALTCMCIPAALATEQTTEFVDFEDPELLESLEEQVYTELVHSLNSENYLVEKVEAIYLSQEYLEEVAFNSQANIYFGYTLSELNEQYEGKRYVFTLGDDGQTVVEEFEDYVEDDAFERILKNVAIGTGVILICVTVMVLTQGTGAYAVNVIFAAAAKGSIIGAAGGTVFGGASAGMVELIKTGDLNEAYKAAAIGVSEGFKWGAISGALSGGLSETFLLYNATASGLTVNEAALIQKETGWSYETISHIKSMDEARLYQKAGLSEVTIKIDGVKQTVLFRKTDLSYQSTLPGGKVVTNLDRMKMGLAPIEPLTGEAYQLHHVNQEVKGIFAVLTKAEHQGNPKILNTPDKKGVQVQISDTWWKTRASIWKELAKLCS